MGLLDDLVRGGRRKAKEVTKDVNEFIEKHDLDDKFEDAKEATIKGVVSAASAIEKGTPVAQIFPFKREDWVHESLPPFSKKRELQDTFKVRSVMNRSYMRQFWQKKSYE